MVLVLRVYHYTTKSDSQKIDEGVRKHVEWMPEEGYIGVYHRNTAGIQPLTVTGEDG